jgi:hypothetical protein
LIDAAAASIDARYVYFCGASLDVDRKFNGFEKGGLHLGDRGGEDLPDEFARFGFAAMRNGFEGGPLFWVGTFVHDRLKCAVPKMDGSRPGRENTPAQAVERDVAEAAFFDLHKGERPAVAVSGQRIELAGATEGAITVAKFDALHGPFHEFHKNPFVQVLKILRRSEKKTGVAGKPVMERPNRRAMGRK